MRWIGHLPKVLEFHFCQRISDELLILHRKVRNKKEGIFYVRGNVSHIRKKMKYNIWFTIYAQYVYDHNNINKCWFKMIIEFYWKDEEGEIILCQKDEDIQELSHSFLE